ncbi:hypothetical protein BOTBODRAFT_596186 [Botryobasidium botryosum FD-172 SS1]|uniref:Uncharacterized protein n=1 Tax=Botryobasidium botryosum (strain FD-172 SS1) TaxID=930990 RepID=A0A067M809_BOTB1|nr:hypothetical protein BOTBODRAFT_596186 [Botryobasidium botryosum FD-172 SS1]
MSSVNALSASEAHSAHIQQPGIITWALGIRTSIAQDRGLDILRDQIQTQGFAFLEDYLDDILSGPKHESLIEMAKTPGRRKAGNRRTRANSAAVSALKVPSHDVSRRLGRSAVRDIQRLLLEQLLWQRQPAFLRSQRPTK